MIEWQLVSGSAYPVKKLAATCYALAAAAYPRAPWRQATFMADIQLPQARYLLACVADQPVGFLSWTVVLDEVEITNVAVHPEFQHQGIAQQLLHACLATVPTGGQIFLEVRQRNGVAQHLYQNNGFKQIATRKNYYRDPIEDAWIMRKIID